MTLVEIMVVVALIASITGMGVWTLSGSLRTQQTGNLARSVLFAMMRARSEAVADGFQRRLACTATGCSLEVGSVQGMSAPPLWRASGYSVQSGTQSMIWAVDNATDVGLTAPAGPMATTRTITFFPDGTATAGTVFVQDARTQQRYKVFVYSATGMARAVDSW